ncbi:MAG: hypothetical protein B6D41_14605 [Chloroflexi bacterium UTCFX4]|nr:MAG: hypothetical protein B6D41_14605 [Chloroflexi bacterium UTCFX4]
MERFERRVKQKREPQTWLSFFYFIFEIRRGDSDATRIIPLMLHVGTSNFKFGVRLRAIL